MKARILLLVTFATGLLNADQLTLKTGQVVNGSYIGGSAETLRFAVGDRVRTYSLATVRNVSFEDAGAPATPAASSSPETVATAKLTLDPIDIAVSTLEPIEPGKREWKAEIFQPVYQGSQLVIPKGARCVLRSVPKTAETRRWDVVLTLASITINGHDYPLPLSSQNAITWKPAAGRKFVFNLQEPITIN